GQPGGYDPAAGTPGVSTAANGGTFVLGLAAVPAGDPPQVDSFQVQHADPTSTVPTGFTIAFSSPIDLQSLSSDGGQTVAGVELVDQEGLVWPVIPVAADDATPRAADDLGVIFPSVLRSGFGVSAALAPGQSVTYRFVMLALPNPQ